MDYGNAIVMLARQRSGTNALRSVLGSHRDIFCFPEVFVTEPNAHYALAQHANYFNFLAKRFPGHNKDVVTLDRHTTAFLDFLEYLYCFTDKRYILLDVKYSSTHHVRAPWKFITQEPLLFELARNHGIHVLHLTRRNYLRYHLSEVKAQQSRRWTVLDATVVGEDPSSGKRSPAAVASTDIDDPRVVIDVEELLRVLALCDSETELARASFSGHGRYLELEYDALFERMGGPVAPQVLARVSDWLGIDSRYEQEQPRYKKQSVLPLSETVANYAEVRDALSGTPWEYCLEDERMYRAPSLAHKGDGYGK